MPEPQALALPAGEANPLPDWPAEVSATAATEASAVRRAFPEHSCQPPPD